ncbi:hypothetical protein [Zavarzinia aquatilis]|uniref:Uncharacterized protein n=1 Tax=Zavarzinia aquatilis TaxID=2211142 RepID=A0A317E5Y4_9PROT|nr:hypothetical protein [Zavarzinia aquatilis]PWR20435.1 hypothetical protein DKG74_15660 [Zavarzinia aquatilis]
MITRRMLSIAVATVLAGSLVFLAPAVFALVFVMIAAYVVDTTDPPPPDGGYAPFRAWLISVDRVEPLSKWIENGRDGLLVIRSVSEVAENALAYGPQIAAALRDPANDAGLREVALTVAQCLPLNDYLRLIEDLQADGLHDIAKEAIIPPLSRRRLDEAFEDPRVRALVEPMRGDYGPQDDIANPAIRLLSGEAARFLAVMTPWTPCPEQYPDSVIEPVGPPQN